MERIHLQKLLIADDIQNDSSANKFRYLLLGNKEIPLHQNKSSEYDIDLESIRRLQIFGSKYECFGWKMTTQDYCISSEKLKYDRVGNQTTFHEQSTPYEIFSHFFVESVYSHITQNPNLYANMKINSTTGKEYLNKYPRSRIAEWKNLENNNDVKLYIGLLIIRLLWE